MCLIRRGQERLRVLAVARDIEGKTILLVSDLRYRGRKIISLKGVMFPISSPGRAVTYKMLFDQEVSPTTIIRTFGIPNDLYDQWIPAEFRM